MVDRPDWDLRLGYLIHDVSRLRRMMFDRALAPLGITRSQWWVLAFISRKDGLPQTQLANELGRRKVGVGALIDRLEFVRLRASAGGSGRPPRQARVLLPSRRAASWKNFARRPTSSMLSSPTGSTGRAFGSGVGRITGDEAQSAGDVGWKCAAERERKKTSQEE